MITIITGFTPVACTHFRIIPEYFFEIKGEWLGEIVRLDEVLNAVEEDVVMHRK